MHFELESAQKHSAEVANGLLANAINNALPKAGIKKPPAYSALFDHGLASKSDQRFASIRSTG
ncbi:hypothetical protein ACNI0L_26925, partial [Escherichia coli]